MKEKEREIERERGRERDRERERERERQTDRQTDRQANRDWDSLFYSLTEYRKSGICNTCNKGTKNTMIANPMKQRS